MVVGVKNRTYNNNSGNTAGHIIIKIIQVIKISLTKFIIIKFVSVTIGLYKY